MRERGFSVCSDSQANNSACNLLESRRDNSERSEKHAGESADGKKGSHSVRSNVCSTAALGGDGRSR